MKQRPGTRTIFIGLAIMLVSWWAADDNRLVDALFNSDIPDAIYDPIDLMIDDLKLGFLVGGLVALFGGYRFLTADTKN